MGEEDLLDLQNGNKLPLSEKAGELIFFYVNYKIFFDEFVDLMYPIK